MNASTERTKILQRIANLRARAADDASSEAEIMASMERAEKLMHSYMIDEAELALAESEGRVTIEIVTKTLDGSNGRVRHRMQMCWSSVCRLTNTRGCRWSGSNKMEFTGDAPDVEYALYLCDLIKVGMDRAYAEYRRQNTLVGRNAKATFQSAMALVLNRRIAAMKREQDAERDAAKALREKTASVPLSRSDSTALIILDAFEAKARATEAEFRRRNPRLGQSSGWGFAHGSSSASAAGREAGARLGLGRGVGGQARGQISA